MSVPDHVLAAVAGISPASEAPAATPEPERSNFGIDRSRYPVILGWDPGYFRYDGNPTTGAVASIPVRDGCCSSQFGDRGYFRSAVFLFSRGKIVLTPEGVDFILST